MLLNVCMLGTVCVGVEEVDNGMSLPSHGRTPSRAPLTHATFQSDRKSPSRSMSLSSSELMLQRTETVYDNCMPL